MRSDDLEPAAWQKIAATLRQRWTAERDDHVNNVLGAALVDVLTQHGGPNEPLAFLRLRRAKGPERYRTDYTNHLFNYLVGLPWTADHEAEAFTLFDALSNAADEDARLVAAVAQLHGLTDKLLTSRYQARMSAVEHAEKLTRTELRKKQEESWRAAREGLADQLRKEAAKHPRALAQWLIAESVYLDLVLDRRLKEATAAAWEVLGATPPAKSDRVLDEVLRQRATSPRSRTWRHARAPRRR